MDRIWLRKVKEAGDELQTRLEAVREYVIMEAENIKSDMDHKGMLKPILEYFLEGEA